MTWLELLYPLEVPPLVRTRPMQVLAVGLSRSGTDSLRNALAKLGYDRIYHGSDIAIRPSDDVVWYRIHMKKYHGVRDGRTNIATADFDAVLGDCVACTDAPAALYSKDLIAAYPDAKVILNYRKDIDAWYDSTVATFCGKMVPFSLKFFSFFNAELFWFYRYFVVNFPGFYHGDFKRNGKWVAEEHQAMIRGLVPSENLLEWTVQDGWEPLCNFLGKEVPDTPFPKGNTPAELEAKLGRLLGERFQKAMRNAVIVATLGIGIISWATHSYLSRR